MIFALQTIFRTREFRTLQIQAITCQSNLNRLNLLLNDAVNYSKTHPDINRILQPLKPNPSPTDS